MATGPCTVTVAHTATGEDEAVTIIQVRVGKDKAVPPGGSAVLPCNYSVPSDDVQPLVSWWKDRGPVLTRRIVYEYRAGRFSKGYGGWAGRTALVGQASLEILNITTDDEGKYECEVRVPLVYGAARGYILLSVLNGEHGEQNTVPHSPLGRTAMIVVGVLVSCLLLMGLTVTTVILRGKKKLEEVTEQRPDRGTSCPSGERI
ncbi:N-acetylmuramoyl-L-alanine amidase [Branchiostoma belcheri]|nr:N-acetylmuramoyl-L-alanine amidase [Branchiostoma belcheri]